MKEKGISQYALYTTYNINRSQLNRLRHNENVQVNTIDKLCNILHCRVEDMLGNFDDDNQFDITRADLMRMGLLMGNDSRRRREYLGEKLRIGYSNGKQLLKRLELFGITLAEVEEAMERYEG